MQKKLTLIFDLDGTILDSKIAICDSVNHALEYFEHPESTHDLIVPMIGRPLRNLFSELTGKSIADTKDYVDVYRTHYETIGLQKQELFVGVRELLKDFSQECHLTVATLKPTIVACRLLKHYGVSDYFDHISGIDPHSLQHEKVKMVAGVLNSDKKFLDAKAIMVGDRDIDMQAGKANNAFCIGAVYGFGTAEELKESGADFLAHDFSQVRSIVTEILENK